MFLDCKSLIYLNLAHFNTSKLSNIFGMVLRCNSLIFLNFFNFKLNSDINNTKAFDDINPGVKYCINDNETKMFLLPNDKISECSDPCFQEKNKKVDIFNNTCIESCINNGFKYEYNTIFYEQCPNETFTIACEEEESNNNISRECFKPEIEDYYLDLFEKNFKKCYNSCKYCYGKGNETFNNCKECKDNFKFYTNPNNFINCYPICSNYYYFDELNNFTCTNDLKCPDEYNKLIFDKNKCIDECKNDDIYKYEFNNKCFEKCPENTFTNDTNNYLCIYKLINNENITQRLITTSSNLQIVYECKIEETLNNNCNFLNIEDETEIINIIQENINSLFDSEKGKSQVIKGGNDIIYQLTNGKNEKELLQSDMINNQNLTILDLGECENKLKIKYSIDNNDSLIYLKKENINVKASEKDVQYEIFEPHNFTKLNLSICKDEKINIYFPLILSEETKNTYENMKKLGYNMFNINDPFYQDLCTPYRTENDTDIPLSARIDYIYNNKDSQCQSNCQFSSYFLNSFYINCSCNIERKEEKGEKDVKKFSGKTLYESFYDVLKYANFKILTCYNLTFDIYIFKNNIGNYILILIFSLYLISLLYFIVKGMSPLIEIIKEISSSLQKKNENKNTIVINGIQIQNSIDNKNNEIKMISNPSPKKKKLKKINNKFNKNKNTKKTVYKKKEKLKFSLADNLIKSSISIFSKIPINDINQKENENIQAKIEDKKFNKYELSQLDYEQAIYYDKRTFIQIYMDIISREHILIFTFFVHNDYNISYIKYARFIFLLSTDMAMNIFFFSDDSMHKIFLNYGKYNFIQQIPQIIYTTIISQLLELFLCFLTLTDKLIYELYMN